MSFLTRIFGKTKQREATAQTETSAAVVVTNAIQDAASAFQAQPSSRVVVDADTALTCPAYLRALNVIAQHVAVLPFRYMWLKGDVYVEKEGDANHYLTSVQMMDNMSNYQFYFQLAFRTVHEGEALVYPRIVMGEVMEYVLCDPDTWTHDDYNNEYYVNDIKNGVYGKFKEAEVLHFVWNSIDGKKGIPLWQLCQPALNIYATGDKETEKRFASGGNVSGIITNNLQQNGGGVGQYKTQTLENLADQFEGQQRAGKRIFAMGGDTKFQQMSSSSSDLQFTDQQKRVVNEIARAAGVPTYMLYVETSGTQYNTPEVAQKAFLTQTLEPMLKMIECEFQRKMVPRSLCHKRIFRFDRDAIYTLDLKSKADYIGKTIQNGTHSINDWRKKENQPTIEGGDTIYLSTNLAELGSDKLKGSTATAAPTPQAEPQKKEQQRDSKGRFIKSE